MYVIIKEEGIEIYVHEKIEKIIESITAENEGVGADY